MAVDLLVVDVELLEDCLIEQAALVFVAAAIQFLGVPQQCERGFDESGAG
ncbi:hypothetical protein [Nocardia neocaledoniensis]|nr:hypothetical protein [Nocardia neocaledoniensis]